MTPRKLTKQPLGNFIEGQNCIIYQNPKSNKYTGVCAFRTGNGGALAKVFEFFRNSKLPSRLSLELELGTPISGSQPVRRQQSESTRFSAAHKVPVIVIFYVAENLKELELSVQALRWAVQGSSGSQTPIEIFPATEIFPYLLSALGSSRSSHLVRVQGKQNILITDQRHNFKVSSQKVRTPDLRHQITKTVLFLHVGGAEVLKLYLELLSILPVFDVRATTLFLEIIPKNTDIVECALWFSASGDNLAEFDFRLGNLTQAPTIEREFRQAPITKKVLGAFLIRDLLVVKTTRAQILSSKTLPQFFSELGKTLGLISPGESMVKSKAPEELLLEALPPDRRRDTISTEEIKEEVIYPLISAQSVKKEKMPSPDIPAAPSSLKTPPSPRIHSKISPTKPIKSQPAIEPPEVLVQSEDVLVQRFLTFCQKNRWAVKPVLQTVYLLEEPGTVVILMRVFNPRKIILLLGSKIPNRDILILTVNSELAQDIQNYLEKMENNKRVVLVYPFKEWVEKMKKNAQKIPKSMAISAALS